MAIAVGGIYIDSGKFLVRGVVWGSNVVRKKMGICHHVLELDKVVVLDHVVPGFTFREGCSRKDNPIIVDIIERISGDLLTYSSIMSVWNSRIITRKNEP